VKAVRSFGTDDETVLVVDMELSEGDQSQSMTDVFRLKKTGDTWKILAPSIGIGIPPPSLFATMLIPNPITQVAKGAAKRTACLSNMKQVALGTLMYGADNDDRMPDASKWRASIMPYVQNPETFRCPDDKSGSATSYRMNPLMSKLEQTRVEDPAKTVMIYEGDANGFIARHDGKGTVGFVDGSAKIVDLATYSKLRKHK
jgi:prepilin-type processing-associated H-X9-DG protein